MHSNFGLRLAFGDLSDQLVQGGKSLRFAGHRVSAEEQERFKEIALPRQVVRIQLGGALRVLTDLVGDAGGPGRIGV